MGGRERERRLNAECIVTVHRDLGALHQEGLHEVVGEGVVVVDEEQAHTVTRIAHRCTRDHAAHETSPAIANARAAEPLLASTSSYSLCGTLSATMPAPAW